MYVPWIEPGAAPVEPPAQLRRWPECRQSARCARQSAREPCQHIEQAALAAVGGGHLRAVSLQIRRTERAPQTARFLCHSFAGSCLLALSLCGLDIIVAIEKIYATLILMTTAKINVASICCSSRPDALPGAMDNEPWQKRAKRAGLTQKTLASLLGVAENTVSLQLRGKWQTGTPKYVKFAILMWEQSSQETKDKMLDWASGEGTE